MSNELAVPDYLKTMMSSGEVTNDTASLVVQAGGVPRISTRGKVFRFKEGDDEIKAGQSITCIIVGSHPVNGLSHTYYIDGYTPDSSSPPDCSSMDGIAPDYWVSNKQSELCVKCPNQVWGSAKSMKGGKAKACKDSKQLYVAIAKDFGENPENCKLWLLQITVNSLQNLSNYAKILIAKGLPGPQFCITEISMDEEAAVPMLKFELKGVLNEKLGRVSNTRNKNKEWNNFQSNQSAIPTAPTAPVTAVSDDNKGNNQSIDDLIGTW